MSSFNLLRDLNNSFLFIARTQSAMSFVFIFNSVQLLHRLTCHVYSFVLARSSSYARSLLGFPITATANFTALRAGRQAARAPTVSLKLQGIYSGKLNELHMERE